LIVDLDVASFLTAKAPPCEMASSIGRRSEVLITEAWQ
jgi:hypothetical protein